MGRHRAHEKIRIRFQILAHTDALTFQAEDAGDTFCGEQFVAAGMQAAQYLDRCAVIDCDHERTRKFKPDICFAICQFHRRVDARVHVHIGEVGKAIGAQQFLGEVERCVAGAGGMGESNCGRIERSIFGVSIATAGRSNDAYRSHTGQEAAAVLDDLHGLLPPMDGATRQALSDLQLNLELVEEAKIRSAGDDFLRARLDHARLLQAQRIETH